MSPKTGIRTTALPPVTLAVFLGLIAHTAMTHGAGSGRATQFRGRQTSRRDLLEGDRACGGANTRTERES